LEKRIRAKIVRSTIYGHLVSLRGENGSPLREALTLADFCPGETVEIRAIEPEEKD
jgi:hypothetical protein